MTWLTPRPYYFVSTLLPPLTLDQKPALPSFDLYRLLDDNLSPRDLAKTKTVRLLVDLDNLAALWQGSPLDPHGNFSKDALEEALNTGENLPKAFLEHFEKYREPAACLAHFSELTSHFFREMLPQQNGFLYQLFRQERDLKLITTGFRAKLLGRNLAQELQFEDPLDEVVAQIMAQRDAKTFEPPLEYLALKEPLEKTLKHPHKLYHLLAQYRLDRFEEDVLGDRFSLERILAYLASLIVVEQYQMLHQPKQGEHKIAQWLGGMQNPIEQAL